MSVVRPQYTGSYIFYNGSYAGRATLRVILQRQTRTGRRDMLDCDVEITRNDIFCIYKALKMFADSERHAIQELPL